MTETPFKFAVGDHVEKTGGDYYFDGIVVSTCRKLSGVDRYVVENPAGILHIYGPNNLRLKQESS